MKFTTYDKEAQYAPISYSDGSTDDLHSNSPLCETNPTRNQPSVWKRFLLPCSLALNAVFAVGFGAAAYRHYQHSSRLNPELRQCSTYTPLHDRIDLEFETKLLNGTFYPKKIEPSIARQRPSPEVDAVWQEWGWTRVVPLTSADIIKMGKDPSVVAKLEDKDFGLGDDAYAGTLDIFHQLHCVDTLRQIAYGSYYNKTTITMETQNQTRKEMHLNHCIDMLVQNIQCSGNLNVITMNWVELGGNPFPDMSVNRKCINFEKLTEWRKTNTVDLDHYVEVMAKAPKGVKKAPMADAYYEEAGLVNPNHLNGANPGIEFNI